MFGNCNHCCFCCGHPFTMLGISLFISCKDKIQCVCVKKKPSKKDECKEKYFFKYKKMKEQEIDQADNGVHEIRKHVSRVKPTL